MLQLILKNQQLSGEALRDFAKAGWSKACCQQKESRVGLQLKNEKTNQPLFLTIVFDWEMQKATLVFSKKNQTNLSYRFMDTTHQIELKGQSLSSTFDTYLTNIPAPTFRHAERDVYMRDILKNKRLKKELFNVLDSLEALLGTYQEKSAI